MSVNSNPTASQQNKKKLPVSKFFPFLAGAVDTGDSTFTFQYLLEFCEKISNDPKGILRGLGETDS
jgi:hypothetical protein